VLQRHPHFAPITSRVELGAGAESDPEFVIFFGAGVQFWNEWNLSVAFFYFF